MGLCGTPCCYIFFTVILSVLVFTAVDASHEIDDRCKDESFCKAYCLSTNPETVSARCGRDFASCICITPDNHAVKVRFIEERIPVPPTKPTTPRPATQYHGVQYVNSQALPSSQQYNYNGNGNSIAGSPQVQQQQQQQQQRQDQSQLTPVLLECDASEMSTRMCHLFCTMEIRAWYGLCNITSKACACFGIPLSAVQQEPIAAIFHSTAPVTPAPITTTTPKPTYTPPRPGYQQFYPPQQYLQQQQPQHPSQQQQQQWKPIQPNGNINYQQLYNNNQFYPASSPTVLNAAVTPNGQQQDQGPVRSAANMFGPNGQPVSPSILTPAQNSADVTLQTSAPVSSFNVPLEPESPPSDNNSTSANDNAGQPDSTVKASRKRRALSVNDTPKDKEKDVTTGKDLASSGECSRFKCAIACKRNNYLAPDCQPKCIDRECWCECFPRL